MVMKIYLHQCYFLCLYYSRYPIILVIHATRDMVPEKPIQRLAVGRNIIEHDD